MMVAVLEVFNQTHKAAEEPKHVGGQPINVHTLFHWSRVIVVMHFLARNDSQEAQGGMKLISH